MELLLSIASLRGAQIIVDRLYPSCPDQDLREALIRRMDVYLDRYVIPADTTHFELWLEEQAS